MKQSGQVYWEKAKSKGENSKQNISEAGECEEIWVIQGNGSNGP